MQIVKNLDNHGMVIMEATYTLTEMEADHIEDSFVNARGQLERAFKKAYNKTDVERVEKGAIEKWGLTDKKQMNKVMKAVRDGKVSIEKVREQFEITDEVREFFKFHEVEL